MASKVKPLNLFFIEIENQTAIVFLKKIFNLVLKIN